MSNISAIRLSGVTYTLLDSNALHTLDNTVTSGGTNAVKGSGIYDAITASSAAVLETVGQAGYQTATDVENAISGKADSSTVDSLNSVVTAHTANTDIHVTVADKTAWNAKLDASDIEGLFGAVNYDSTSKRINFYNTSTGGTVLAYVDATDFVKDGFLQSVTIENKTIEGQSVPCLVFVWNTDAGISETDIPISGIFDPTNYVSVSDFNTYTAATATAISGKVDTSTFETYSGSVETALSGKQDTLVSGTSIKTINNESLLGSGNITIEQGSVDQTIISGSTNAVAGGAVYTALAGKNGVITLDSDTLVIS